VLNKILVRSAFSGNTWLFTPVRQAWRSKRMMENSEDQDQDDDTGGGGGFQIEHLQSYLNFAKFSLRKRWRMLVMTLITGVCLSVLASIYVPRTFACTTVLMPASSGVLDSRDTPNYLAGASDLILRHENLETIIRDLGLIEKFSSRRPPLLQLKDRLSAAIAGPMPRQIQIASLVGTLENKIEVTAEKGDLTIKVSWSDPQTAAELAVAARESFIKARHTSEFSAFEEKMAIVDGHGQKLREEIGVLADQLKGIRDQKLDEANALRKEAAGNAKAARLAAEKAEMAQVAPRTNAPVAPDTQTPELKDRLTALNAKLSAAEAERDQRLRAAQAKLDDLKVKLTPLHPEVIAQEQQVAILSETPSDLALMRAEAKDLAGELKQRLGLSAIGSNLGGGRVPSAAEQLLPPDVTELLDKDNLDPALTAQLSSTVVRYAALRDELLNTRVELDTAQAAFNHRYQVIVPAEVPTKPEKPKPGVVIGVGLLLSLLLALALPIFSELRKGVIVERWQVQHLQLPVLAELHLPPNSPD
jgi:uncharacterized protein involved in exopolysaccharide biosynthesis